MADHNPSAHTAPTSAALKIKNRRKLPLHRLPFVDTVPNKIGISFWAVPQTGGYAGGCRTGKSVARIYLKHLKSYGDNTGDILQRVVLDMLGSDAKDETPGQDALRGQIVGFFTELEPWLIGATKYLDDGLEAQEEKALLKAANEGLNFDEQAYIDALQSEHESAEHGVEA